MIVFIHGGQHDKTCWDPTIEAIKKLAPSRETLAINLPGRGDIPGDLKTLNIAKCVESATEQIMATNPESVALVGHSMAGVTMPGVAANLGVPLLTRMIFVACATPEQGKCILDILQFPMNIIIKFSVKLRGASSPPLPTFLALQLFGNGMNRRQKEKTKKAWCAETTNLLIEPVDRSNMPEVPMTWVLPLRDRALRPSMQRKFMENLGGIDDVEELDTCHDAMISEPEKLAQIIVDRC
ncbi:MAG: alpha/beta hydrolase [Pseudomonadota bacterium]